MQVFFRFNGKTFKNYTTTDGISDLKITALKTGPLGNIIIVNKKGLDILNTKTGTVSYITNKQGIGEVSTDMGSVTQDMDGNIVLTTTS